MTGKEYVSIPYSTIKIDPGYTNRVKANLFQFLIVRLKSSAIVGLSFAPGFQFLIVRLKSKLGINLLLLDIRFNSL